ncbi:MAG: effector protein [Clostridium butyricum]|nr:effector protein [Clostridium butyricum]
MSYKIFGKKKLMDEVYLIDIEAPDIVKTAKIGLFIIVKNNNEDNDISLEIIDYNKERKIITVVLQRIKDNIKKLELLKERGFIFDIMGPFRVPYVKY